MPVFTTVALILIISDLFELKKQRKRTLTIYFTLTLIAITGAGLYYGKII
ncbi:MAG: hypothetical protein LBC82_03040 [Oscillospiraceae bacterium]|jgi:hypothetical protein|nr:hypothetical protein [Oscillospiraceae bacterium]